MPRKQSVGPSLVALGGVVEHHVEDHLDAGPVQGLDHVAELVHRAERVPARAVRRVRGEERDRLVAPVVDLPGGQSWASNCEDRQQLDRGDAELLEVRDLLDQPGVGAARLLADAGVGVAREPADVHLVDDRSAPTAGAAARRPPSRRRRDRRPRSSSRSRRCRPAAGRPRGCSPSGTTTPRPYGSSSTLAGSNRRPLRGLGRPLRRGSRRVAPACTPGHERVPVVVGAVRPRDRGGRRGRASRRPRGRRTAAPRRSAVRENRLKLTPPSTTVAPRGELRPMFSETVMGGPRVAISGYFFTRL